MLRKFGCGYQDTMLAQGYDLGEIAVGDDYPTLGLVATTYGRDIATYFVKLCLSNLNKFAGQTGGLKPEQILELAAILANEYAWLNLAEFHVFFIRFKAGHYGTFYGTVDPIKIGNAFQTFIKERWQEIDAYEQEQRKRQQQKSIEERSRNAMTYQEYQELLKRSQNGDMEAKRLLQQP